MANYKSVQKNKLHVVPNEGPFHANAQSSPEVLVVQRLNLFVYWKSIPGICALFRRQYTYKFLVAQCNWHGSQKMLQEKMSRFIDEQNKININFWPGTLYFE